VRETLTGLLILTCVACGGGASYTEGTFTDRTTTFHVEPPGEGWRRLEVESQNDLAFEHAGTATVMQVNASCDAALDIPLVALTNHLLVGFTERSELEPQAVVPMDGREALRTHVLAKLDGVSRELLLTVLKKDGCVYDFALLGPPGAPFAEAQPAYDAMLAGFRTEGAR
jgi:hypothetical protein